jgi:hypothetical protein
MESALSKDENPKSQESSKWTTWKKAFYMLAFLLTGIALAIGHHCFHASLDGKPVTSSTQQQWYGRVSLGFALLVRYCFKISVSITIVQAVWYGLRTKATQMGTIDAVTQLLSDPLRFFRADVWRFSWPLVTFALFSWYDPLCSPEV